MMRTVAAVFSTFALVACSSHGYHTPLSQWERPPEPNQAAGQTQRVTARQAKEAQCKGEVAQRPGSTGTNTYDYKCKRFT